MDKHKQNIKVAVDAVVFGYRDQQLYVLLIKQKYGPFKDWWALPGGFVQNGESLETAVKRELKEETGLSLNYLEQLYTFGKPDRDPRGQVLSVAWYGLVNATKFKLKAATDAAEAEWFSLAKLPKLAYDHAQILKTAKDRLRGKLSYQPIGFNLLEREFPFSDLEQLYMTILGRKLDRRNFHRKLMSFDLLEDTGKKRKIGSGRPASIFRFNKLKYKALEKEGFLFEIKFA